MSLSVSFFFTVIMLGVGVAMDAFSVSLANGLGEPNMKKHKMVLIAGVFAAFQILMPLTGWFCVSTIANLFCEFKKFIPWIALILLCYIGGKMIYESVKGDEEEETAAVGFLSLLVQGVATSIDALSVGFEISDYTPLEAIIGCSIIGVITFFICFAGLAIGKKAGTKLANNAKIFGGSVLIFIGLEIFVSNIFF